MVREALGYLKRNHYTDRSSSDCAECHTAYELAQELRILDRLGRQAGE